MRIQLVKIVIIISVALLCALIYGRWRDRAEKSSQTPSIKFPQDNRKEKVYLPNFTSNDFVAPVTLITRLKTEQDPLTKYLRSRQSESTRRLLEDYKPPKLPSQALLDALVDEFNNLLFDISLYEPGRFARIELSERTREELKILKSEGLPSYKLNRMLLEDAYPHEILSKERIVSKVEGTVTATQLLDEFTKQPEVAKGKYIGKRYLIRGVIGEVIVEPYIPTRLWEDWEWDRDSRAERRSVMLISNEYFPYRGIRLPFKREDYIGMDLSISEASIQFQGIYCRFLSNFIPHEFGREKQGLVVSCEIVGFEKGVTRLVKSRYGSRLNRADEVYEGEEKDRVIAVNCIEKSYLLEKF
ncbi:MAG TPA: hypothetical protein VF544_12765 [Pyrinomonadaceae bacterium]|jgi:hypothetical protein